MCFLRGGAIPNSVHPGEPNRIILFTIGHIIRRKNHTVMTNTNNKQAKNCRGRGERARGMGRTGDNGIGGKETHGSCNKYSFLFFFLCHLSHDLSIVTNSFFPSLFSNESSSYSSDDSPDVSSL